MSGIATAIAGGAVLGAVVSSQNASSAADAQTQASQNSIGEQQREFNINQQNQAPYLAAGQTAVGQISNGTAAGGAFNSPYTMADFYTDPAYQFNLSQGLGAIQKSAAATGGVLSGGALKSIDQYAQQNAGNEYQNAFTNYQTDLSGRYNRLASLAGLGQTAVGTLGNQGTASAANIGNTMVGIGNAQAAGYVGQSNALNNGISSLGNYYMQNQYLNKLPNYGGTPSTYASPGSSYSVPSYQAPTPPTIGGLDFSLG